MRMKDTDEMYFSGERLKGWAFCSNISTFVENIGDTGENQLKAVSYCCLMLLP